MNPGNHKGQALVELALSLLLLLFLIFGCFEFGRAMYIRNSLNFAAREGARRASVSEPWDIAAVQSRVTDSLPVSLQTGLVITVSPVSPQHGIDTVRVVVQVPFTTVVPDLLTQLARITTLSAEAAMRYE